MLNEPETQGRETREVVAESPGENQGAAACARSAVFNASRVSGSLSEAHLYERTDVDRAEGPEDDRWAERNERWFGWGEDWDAE